MDIGSVLLCVLFPSLSPSWPGFMLSIAVLVLFLLLFFYFLVRYPFRDVPALCSPCVRVRSVNGQRDGFCNGSPLWFITFLSILAWLLFCVSFVSSRPLIICFPSSSLSMCCWEGNFNPLSSSLSRQARCFNSPSFVFTCSFLTYRVYLPVSVVPIYLSCLSTCRVYLLVFSVCYWENRSTLSLC